MNASRINLEAYLLVHNDRYIAKHMEQNHSFVLPWNVVCAVAAEHPHSQESDADVTRFDPSRRRILNSKRMSPSSRSLFIAHLILEHKEDFSELCRLKFAYSGWKKSMLGERQIPMANPVAVMTISDTAPHCNNYIFPNHTKATLTIIDA